MNATGAFLRRDFLVAWSYRFSFFFEQFGVLLSLVTTRFIGELIAGGSVEELARYGGDYFSFALIGMAVQMLVLPAVIAFRGAIREAQVLGTFEAMLATRARPLTIALSSGAYSIASASVRVLVTLMVIGIAMGARFHAENPVAVVIALILTLAIAMGLGLISAAFTIAMKQSEPFTLGLLSISAVVSGVLYPTEVLPGPIAALAPLSPLTHVLELLRGLLLEDAEISLMRPFLATAAFALLFPVGVLAMRRSIEFARERGTLAQY